MLSPCRCSPRAEASLREILAVEDADPIDKVEVEFREVPYFLVSRSLEKWKPEEGDINEITILQFSDRGMVVDAEGRTKADGSSMRQTLVPWQNIISLSITRAGDGAEGN